MQTRMTVQCRDVPIELIDSSVVNKLYNYVTGWEKGQIHEDITIENIMQIYVCLCGHNPVTLVRMMLSRYRCMHEVSLHQESSYMQLRQRSFMSCILFSYKLIMCRHVEANQPVKCSRNQSHDALASSPGRVVSKIILVSRTRTTPCELTVQFDAEFLTMLSSHFMTIYILAFYVQLSTHFQALRVGNCCWLQYAVSLWRPPLWGMNICKLCVFMHTNLLCVLLNRAMNINHVLAVVYAFVIDYVLVYSIYSFRCILLNGNRPFQLRL